MKKLTALLAIIMLAVFVISACTTDTSESKKNSSAASAISQSSNATSAAASGSDNNSSKPDSSVSGNESVTTSAPLDNNQSFTFKVKDSMPEYKCVAKIDTSKNAITEIIITEKDSGKAIQTITPKENDCFMKSALYFEDVTFDGAVDILVPITKSNRRLYIGAYRWDETKKQFIYQEDFEELGNIKIDSTNKKIMTHNSIWLDSGRNAEVYSVYKYSNNKFVLEKQFSITPSEDKKTAAFKETSGDIDKQTIVTQFELALDSNGGFDKNNNKIKPYYVTGSAWDLNSDKWVSQFIKELK